MLGYDEQLSGTAGVCRRGRKRARIDGKQSVLLASKCTLTLTPFIWASIPPAFPHAHDSVVILALPLVTFTPNSLARVTISIRLREDTACAILSICQNHATGHCVIR